MEGTPLATGKLPAALLGRLLSGLPKPDEVVVGPAIGEDACAIRVPGGLLVAATDPITLTSAGAARLAVILNANDVAVMGVRPRWFLAAVLLPPAATEGMVTELFEALRAALDEVGAYLVGGHTEVSTAVTRPVVVGQMLGIAGPDGVVTTGGARVGDVIVQVGAAPVEGAAVLATELASRLRDIDPVILEAALRAMDDPGVSVVAPALAATALGATSLHDPTEGGLAAALHELAASAGVAVRVDADAIQWFGPGLAVCRALGADPWATLASGALLAAFAPGLADRAVATLNSRGYPSAAIGSVEGGHGVRDATGREVAYPERDEVARILAG